MLVLCYDFRCECYDYLFDIAVEMKLHGIDPTAKPTKWSNQMNCSNNAKATTEMKQKT